MSTPAVCLNNSVVRCAAAPIPDEPNEILPGFAFAYAISSLTSFTGRLLFAVMISGAIPTSDTGAKPLTGSNGSFPAYSVAFAACAAITVRNVAPSGGAFATRSAPRIEFAPGLFSTTIVAPACSCTFCTTIRVALSVMPPGVVRERSSGSASTAARRFARGRMRNRRVPRSRRQA
jgi:hypothetical protein